jgi:heme-degrading monooxygenase HmoA
MTTIFRQWSGVATSANASAYPEHFKKNVVPELEGINGFIGADLVARDLGDTIEYTVISRWGSMGAIKAFAGENFTRAVVEPGAKAALQSYATSVTHFEVIASIGSTDLL